MAFHFTKSHRAEWIGAALALLAFLVVVTTISILRKHAIAPTSANTNAMRIVRVSQRNRHFHPDTLTIAPGTVVHIMNDDTVTHHVYVKSAVMNFDSGEQPVGTTVDLEFDHRGTFTALCAIHPTMHLRVIVK
jgi:plastocyanin